MARSNATLRWERGTGAGEVVNLIDHDPAVVLRQVASTLN
jgi:hypothetical protein